jgi:ribosome modulation factor
MTNELVTPRTQGRDGYRTGLPASACPYADYHHAREWAEGWAQEARASAGQRCHLYSIHLRGRSGVSRIVRVWADHATQAIVLADDMTCTGERVMSAKYMETRTANVVPFLGKGAVRAVRPVL